jgi:Domain of unknown function (DUF4326)
VTTATDSGPRRLQRRRARGWRKPAEAVNVDGTSRWGNPFAVGRPAGPLGPDPDEIITDRARAVAIPKEWFAAAAGRTARGRPDPTRRPRFAVPVPAGGAVPRRRAARLRQSEAGMTVVPLPRRTDVRSFAAATVARSVGDLTVSHPWTGFSWNFFENWVAGHVS